ncbi:DUF262 domain-containing protein [Leptolyngbya sp. O-77]|uniref:GmrSD restriction endonuclease domain-containing protein n=1 Tax=Leptolyngbya sp. O-77 TaxID=1080068 RepID=UPI00074D2C8A|nr:DUF262 domain-containing protein [Leptolyngbya sp. O-77]BAU42819.1 Divergent AAA domain protein [Leptolyngbya sp. O-77]
MAELVSQPTSVQSVYTWYVEDKLYVNRRYQRKLVWTLEEKQKLIESILKKYPVPAILIAERDNAPGTYEIIDGLQRLQAIMSFVETAFSAPDGKYFDLQHFPTAKSRADEGLFVPNSAQEYLSQREVSTILDYTLALSVMRNATETEINDVFDRINTFGRRLSDQERRQAGVQNDFSNMVRKIACTLRGDNTADILLLRSMPSISIDLPMTKHGYAIPANEVFWVNQGILRSTDLRDSMDEQCIADIAVCITSGQMIERSKDALDAIYRLGSPESERVSNALEVYGSEKFTEEFKFCIDEIIKVCNEGKPEKLRDIVFKKRTTNAFPSVFASILIAFHELIIKEGKKITDYAGIRKDIVDLAGKRLETRATSSSERRKNIDQIKGLIGKYFVEADIRSQIYGNHATTDIEEAIRRSEIELADYELKQGLLSLSDQRGIDPQLIDKVIRTIAAIANNGTNRVGKVIIGVTDKDADAERIKNLDGIEPKKIGKRFVVGVIREAKVLGLSVENYFSKWKEAIKNSEMSLSLKNSILSNMDFNSFYGLGIIVITIPPQKELSYVGEEIYWRNSDSTELAETPKQIAMLAQRF